MIEATFSAIAKCLDRNVNFDLNAPVSLRWDDRCRPALREIAAYGVSVIIAVCEYHFRRRHILIYQDLVAFHVMHFARSERGQNWEALRVRPEMNLGREATSRTAMRVSVNPPFRPLGSGAHRLWSKRSFASSWEMPCYRQVLQGEGPIGQRGSILGIAYTLKPTCQSPLASRSTLDLFWQSRKSNREHASDLLEGDHAWGRSQQERARRTPTRHRKVALESTPSPVKRQP